MQVAPTLVPLLKFYFHEEVRKAAVSGRRVMIYTFLYYLKYFLFKFVRLLLILSWHIFYFVSSHAGVIALCKISCGEGNVSRA